MQLLKLRAAQRVSADSKTLPRGIKDGTESRLSDAHRQGTQDRKIARENLIGFAEVRQPDVSNLYEAQLFKIWKSETPAPTLIVPKAMCQHRREV
jgi:hypothetical protein